MVTASGENEALDRIKEVKPDLIILDVMMDHLLSGFNLSQKIKKDASYKGIPILILTAVDRELHLDFQRHAEPRRRDEGDEFYLPVDDYIQKPVKPEKLLSRVANLLNKTQQSAETTV